LSSAQAEVGIFRKAYAAFFSSKNPERKSKAAAMLMQESATLNVGHHPPLEGMIFSKPGNQTLMKSTT
jgi:hypothetical protein